ncbi:hypothetical protein TSMEX_009599 [Taenia solium]|eukprot:TsM_000373200 transcript=TsM_000373200 gene=TsM_000373200
MTQARHLLSAKSWVTFVLSVMLHDEAAPSPFAACETTPPTAESPAFVSRTNGAEFASNLDKGRIDTEQSIRFSSLNTSSSTAASTATKQATASLKNEKCASGCRATAHVDNGESREPKQVRAQNTGGSNKGEEKNARKRTWH